jgi:signal transduction histidine kinase
MSAAGAHGAPPGRRVLIVDDDLDFAESLADILDASGYLPSLASGAEAALTLIKASAPSVALVDLRLGFTSGMDLLVRLSAERPNLICVVMTAHADAQSAIEALRSGAYDYFDKTCAPNELLAVLSRCFEKIQLQEERKAAYEALREAKEEAEAANRAKSEFLATISHELRTPLNAVIGFSEMMMAETLGPLGNAQYVSYAKDIFDSGSHLLNIINDILDLSKAEAGRLELSEGEADVAATIGAVCRILRPRAEEAGLTLTAAVPSDLPPLYADERKVKQMLLNLIGNAIKFTPGGGRIEVVAQAGPGEDLSICVSDTGIGMSKSELSRALQPFVQIDSALNRRHSGTGLGLPLVAAMIGLHGGDLALSSAPGQGTCAVIRFPWNRLLWPARESVEAQPQLA